MRTPEAKAALTDLTWALNQAAEAILDPRVAFDVYRIPAGPTALASGGEGVLHPGPECMPRRTQPSNGEWERLLDGARFEAVALLHEEIALDATLPER